MYKAIKYLKLNQMVALYGRIYGEIYTSHGKTYAVE